MIQSVFELGDTPAREVMVPRTEMVWIESDKSAAQATSLAVRSGHSRIPVIGENVDDVLGVVYPKDLVRRTYYSASAARDILVAEVMRPAVFIPDSKPLDDLLRRCSATANHGPAGRRVRRHRGPGHHRGRARGDRRRIADEVRDTDEVAPVEDLGDKGVPGLGAVADRGCRELYDIQFEEASISTPSAVCWRWRQLGRVPLPGAGWSPTGCGCGPRASATTEAGCVSGTVLVRPADHDGQEPER